MRQIWISRPGEPEVLEVRSAPDPRPAAGQVRIRVGATGINFADIMARMGVYPDAPPPPSVVGYEVAGEVNLVGPGASQDLLGREVLAMTRFGGYSDVVTVPEGQVFLRPEGMTVEEGAALPVNYFTAYQLVVVMGGLRAGDTVLVHSAGGGVGIAAIQLAKHIGAQIIGTASARKHGALSEMGVDHLIDYRTEDFEARVKEITEGRGVELILDAVGGSSFKKGLRVLARTGRLGMFGMSSAAPKKSRSVVAFARTLLSMPLLEIHPGRLMNGNMGVFGVNLGHMWGEGERIRSWGDALLELYSEGAVRPHVDATFSFDEAPAAHHYIQDRKNLGKVLLVP